VLDSLETLFQSYVNSEDPKKLAKICIENINAFHAFAVLCLKHTVGVMTWKVKHRKMSLSDIYSISDEALALVSDTGKQCPSLERKGIWYCNSNSTGGRYMRQSKDGSIRKDWSDEGKKRFNDLFCQVREQRAFSLSTTNEMTLKALWNRTSRNQRCQEITNADYGQGVGNNEGEDRVTFIYEG
jgi:hypothetical protein